MGKLTEFEKEWMAERHMKLIPHTIKSFYSTIPHEELMGAGYMGLTKALQEFDTDKNVKFSTFACVCISNEIKHFLRKENKFLLNYQSLSSVLTTDKNGHALELEDTISIQEQDNSLSADKLLLQDELKYKIKRSLDTLTEKQRIVIIKRYGLDGKPPRTQNEIALSIGMSQANVSKIEDDALERLKYVLYDCKKDL